MFDMRLSHERGAAHHGWLQSKHTFSFANYWDPKQVGFSDLLVINDDTVAPSKVLVLTLTATWKSFLMCLKVR